MAELGERSKDHRIHADNVEFLPGQGAFGLKLVDVRAFENQEAVRFYQPASQDIGHLLAERIVVAVAQQRAAVAGLVAEAADGDLANADSSAINLNFNVYDSGNGLLLNTAVFSLTNLVDSSGNIYHGVYSNSPTPCLTGARDDTLYAVGFDGAEILEIAADA